MVPWGLSGLGWLLPVSPDILQGRQFALGDITLWEGTIGRETDDSVLELWVTQC